MESQFFGFLLNLTQSSGISDSSLILVVIFILLSLTFYIFRPLKNKVDESITKQDIETIIISSSQKENTLLIENSFEINEKLDKLIEVLDEVEDFGKGSYREIKDLKKDIEQIKQILNQFQGHLMYSRSDFGNRELR